MRYFLHFACCSMLFIYGFFVGDFLEGYEIDSSAQTAHLICHVKECVRKAELMESQLTKDILQLEGMSSDKVRHLLNNLCALPNASYLEIGMWQGSTFISALYGNRPLQAIGIDNFSEFGAPRREFLDNCQKYLIRGNYQFHDQDCFSLPKDRSIFKQPINIYFYDGNHSAESHEQSLSYFQEVWDDVLILVVDDWNCAEVRLGTERGLTQVGYDVKYELLLPAQFNGDKDLWWNGLYVAVLQRQNM